MERRRFGLSQMKKNNMHKKVILASGSPRRKELLREMGVEFEVDVSDVDETADGRPEQMVAVLAERKARAVAQRRNSGLIVAADTLVALEDRALGKPADDAEAREMLHALSGRTHDVFTGVCVLDAGNGRMCLEAVRTGVRFRELTDAEIDAYVATGEPRDKAGAYAIQGGAGAFVEGYEGSRSNVIGLPVERLSEMLEQMGG